MNVRTTLKGNSLSLSLSLVKYNHKITYGFSNRKKKYMSFSRLHNNILDNITFRQGSFDSKFESQRLKIIA